MIFFKILFDKGYWKRYNKDFTIWQKVKIAILSIIGGLVIILSFGHIMFVGDVILAMKYNAMAKKE